MWQPISLKIKNLFSYEDAYFTFKNGEITVVYGKNQDADNTDSCGSGKSSFLDCISISLLGEPLRSVGKNDIVRNGEKSGSTIFELHNPILNKDLRIESIINTGSTSSKVLIYENNVLNTNFADLKAADGYKYIISLIGISKEDLMNYFLISKESYQSFFLSGDTQKKEIINRFSKADIIDNVNPHIDEDIKLLNEQINTLNTQLNSNNTALNIHNEDLQSELVSSSIEQTRQLIIKTLTDEKKALEDKFCKIPIERENINYEIVKKTNCLDGEKGVLSVMVNIITGLEFQITGSTTDLNVIRQKETSIESEYQPKFKEIDDKITESNDEILKYDKAIKESNKTIAEYEKQLAGTIDCPKCDHKFSLQDKEFDHTAICELVDTEKEIIIEIQGFIKDSQCDISSLEIEKTTLKTELQLKLQSFVTDKARINTHLTTLNASLEQNQLNKKAKEKEINNIQDEILKLEREIKNLQLEETSLSMERSII